MHRRLPLFLILILMLASCKKDDFMGMVLPADPERLEELQREFGVEAKYCKGYGVKLRVFLETSSQNPQDILDKDALLEITAYTVDGPFRFWFEDRIKTEPGGQKLFRTLTEIFLIESVVDEKTLMPTSLKNLLTLKFFRIKVVDKLFRIFPERDLTIEDYRALTNSLAPEYNTLIERCIWGL